MENWNTDIGFNVSSGTYLRLLLYVTNYHKCIQLPVYRLALHGRVLTVVGSPDRRRLYCCHVQLAAIPRFGESIICIQAAY